MSSVPPGPHSGGPVPEHNGGGPVPPPSGTPHGAPQPGPIGGQTAPARPGRPTLFNGATTHGLMGQRGIRHPWELPLFFVGAAITVIAYGLWTAFLILLAVLWSTGALDKAQQQADKTPATDPNSAQGIIMAFIGNQVAQVIVVLMFLPLILWLLRAMMYAKQRAYGTRMSPTQFPEGYRMVVEAARHHGLRRVPDAYVVLGNGTINAFASGHGFRRFVVIHSDMFEIGGKVRDPEALRFVIGHEVGHLAAGHVSYFRLLLQGLIMQIPLLGMALSRAQEYTADNYGYGFCPQGAPGTMAVLAAGKYLNADVNVNELADRAATEKGFWLHLVNWQATHPITTWRAAALRDRSKPGSLWLRPRRPVFDGPLPAGSTFTKNWPTPDEVLSMLDQADAARPSGTGDQWGRFPGVDYSSRVSIREQQTAAPLLSRPHQG